jgi:hypothetical protein
MGIGVSGERGRAAAAASEPLALGAAFFDFHINIFSLCTSTPLLIEKTGINYQAVGRERERCGSSFRNH